MTLSAMGDAETPAGGSVCIRCVKGLSAPELRQYMVSLLEDHCDLQYVLWKLETFLRHCTLKSRMRRLRAGVVIFQHELGSKLG